MDTPAPDDTWTALLPPGELAAEIARWFRGNPAKCDQGTWWSDLEDSVTVPLAILREELLNIDCKTTACTAGWAIALAAPPGTMIVRAIADPLAPDAALEDDYLILPGGWRWTITGLAARLLGIPLPTDGRAMPWLFRAERTHGEVLSALDHLAAGRHDPPGADYWTREARW